MPPPQPTVGRRPLLTGAILIETSLGSFVVDLYGVDCPTATAEVANLCRCKYFNGCIATDVVPDNVIIFKHPVSAVQQQTFATLLENANARTCCADKPTMATDVARLMCSEWQRMKGHVARLNRGQRPSVVEFVPCRTTEAPGAINRRGLLLVEVPRQTDSMVSSERHPASCLLLTLGNGHLDYYENRFMVVGEVREGNSVINKMRAAPHQRSASVTVIGSRPTRLIRIKHATVLPTASASSFADVSHGSAEAAPEPRVLAAAIRDADCFRHWAPRRAVRAANGVIVRLLRKAAAAASASQQPIESQDAAFFLLHNLPQCADDEEGEEEKTDEILSVEYNPHFHGDYLSSGDDNDVPHADSRNERGRRQQAVLRMHQEKLNETRTLVLNLLDGVADVSGELKPPENVLFVCKLNPLTTGEGLVMCFSQFGTVQSAEVVHDRKTGNSLCYGFVEFSDVDACYRAFQKMDKALVDDHRIHVDFSQSVSKLWAQRQREMRKRARNDA